MVRSISFVRLWFVALMMRTSTTVALLEPTGVTTPSSSTRSNFACIVSGMSPISSRNSVPLSAISNRPLRSVLAPVNAPLTCPNSSLSSSVSVSPAQLTGLNGLSRRSEFMWIARASSSLPVPEGPSIRTEIFVGATRRTTSKMPCIVGLTPLMPSNRKDSGSWSASARREKAAVALRDACSTRVRNWSMSMGLTR